MVRRAATELLIRTTEEITASWVGAVVGVDDVEDLTVTSIGTGQMSRTLRVAFSSRGEPDQVVVKIPATDATSRSTGVGLGIYAREVGFYRELGEQLAGVVPACRLAEYDVEEGAFTLVLQDAAPALPGDQITGCTREDARSAIETLARMQAQVLRVPELRSAAWLQPGSQALQDFYSALLPTFLERYGDRVSAAHREVCERFGPCVDAWVADRGPLQVLTHGDYRLDNILFAADGCTIVDWQTVGWGSALRDVAYFIGASLTVEDRRADEVALIGAYRDALRVMGAAELTWEACWDEYRRQSFAGILMTVIAAVSVESTPRGDEMFMTMLTRSAQQALDTGALDLLPAAPRPALRPNPADEAAHPPGPELLWNESWYFDAVSDDGSLGLYIRLGRLPNQDSCFYAVSICGPDRPSVLVALEAAPLPAADDPAQRIDLPFLRAEQHCVERLQRFRLTVDGTAQAHLDPAAPLRAEAGVPVAIGLDLTWDTDGIPYLWRMTPRYEIPCRVTGTVRIGDEHIAFSGPGQRDHSWAVRDWWAFEWMWSALHLDDGTRVHAFAMPSRPTIGVGYVQSDGELVELTRVGSTRTVAADGLISDVRLELHPTGLQLAVEPVAFGALRLEAPDGRITRFPRAFCRVLTDDGRTGTGWVEWNLPPAE